MSIESQECKERDKTLEAIQDRILWLSVNMVDYANNVRPNPDGVKVGGHQASSASVVTVMTYLYFEYMRQGDQISIKPHASPVYHAIQYLLGNLNVGYLKQFRAFRGLQSYPSRTKDPDGVDFSTGSVGIGGVAPNFSAMAEEYTRSHFDYQTGPDRRYISLLGDAELDEGSVWEAIAEPSMSELRNVLWIVDLNRQSLDRVIPGIRVKIWREMFAANGWRVIDAKYGKKLQLACSQPRGELLEQCIDEMSNEVYQRLLRARPETVREWLTKSSNYPKDLSDLIGNWNDQELQELLHNLGGHDIAELRSAFQQIDLDSGPNVIFAYTLKGWRLPSVGDPQNHSVILSKQQMKDLRKSLGISSNDAMGNFKDNSAEGRLCKETRDRLRLHQTQKKESPEVTIPTGLGRGYKGKISTQQMMGLVLTDISRNVPELAKRVVSVSPDVASSTNLGGWINRVGVWSKTDREVLPEEPVMRALKWIESSSGQHIELGISENNLFMLIGQLGLTHENMGEVLFPVGTLYDPFIRRGLDALVYSVYSGSRFIFVGTPSGISLGPEGGAHQSIITPSIGTELPELAFYEPCFGQELEWIMLSAFEKIRLREESTYLRLTSKRIDQEIFDLPNDAVDIERLRQQVLSGAYKLVDRSQESDFNPGFNVVHIMSSGAMIPEVVSASNLLLKEGIYANVVNVTGPGPLYRLFQESIKSTITGNYQKMAFLSDVVPVQERSAPVVTVVDGHPHSLAWLGGALGTSIFPLGVSGYGQSGTPSELYREYGIDSSSIVEACFGALGI